MNIFYLYILLYQDKIVVRDVRTHREMTGIPETPFTTSRLLVGGYALCCQNTAEDGFTPDFPAAVVEKDIQSPLHGARSPDGNARRRIMQCGKTYFLI